MKKVEGTDKKILNLIRRINSDSPQKFYNDIDYFVKNSKKKFIVTANPEIIMMGYKNKNMWNILSDNGTIIIPDGIGVVKVMRIVYSDKSIQRNTGIEFVVHMLEKAQLNDLSIFIYGAHQNVLDRFRKMCDIKYPGINITGLYNGYEYNDDFVLQKLIKSKSDIYFIALGTPRQENFINKFYDKIDKGICVGIGGSIDVLLKGRLVFL